MDIWWNTLLFASKWIFVSLIYIILFTVLQKVRQEMKTHLPADNGSLVSPGRIQFLETGQDRFAQVGKVISLKKNQILIGRHNTNDLILTDETVSRTHARLNWNGRFWELEDLKSGVGSKINGRPLLPHRKSEVPFNSEVSIGNIKFRLIR